MSDFDKWYDTVVKYVEPADIYHWMNMAWDAAKAQKRFDVFAYYADLCGNKDYNHVGCFYAESIEQVQEVFPKGFLCGFEVRQHIDDIRQLPKEVQKVPKEKR